MPDLLALYAAHPAWLWAGLAAALLAVEVATGSGWLLWPAGSAAVTAAAAALTPLPLAGALLAFALLTIVFTLVGRRLMPRSLSPQGHDINDSQARLIGHQGHAVSAFGAGVGRVFVDGKEWAADLEGEGPLAAGGRVEVTAVFGARLRVRPV